MSNIMEDKKSSISNIIDALTKIENNHLNSNRNNAIYSMLKEIGLYTKALYVSIYELVDSSAFEEIITLLLLLYFQLFSEKD